MGTSPETGAELVSKVRINRPPLVMLLGIAVMLPAALIAQATPNEYASEARSLLAMPAIAEAMQHLAIQRTLLLVVAEAGMAGPIS